MIRVSADGRRQRAIQLAIELANDVPYALPHIREQFQSKADDNQAAWGTFCRHESLRPAEFAGTLIPFWVVAIMR
jgi:hypothetical protein